VQQLADFKTQQLEHRSHLREAEKALLEKEFELRELESEKNVKSQDAKLN
jgi:hypothetical protein